MIFRPVANRLRFVQEFELVFSSLHHLFDSYSLFGYMSKRGQEITNQVKMLSRAGMLFLYSCVAFSAISHLRFVPFLWTVCVQTPLLPVTQNSEVNDCLQKADLQIHRARSGFRRPIPRHSELAGHGQAAFLDAIRRFARGDAWSLPRLLKSHIDLRCLK